MNRSPSRCIVKAIARGLDGDQAHTPEPKRTSKALDLVCITETLPAQICFCPLPLMPCLSPLPQTLPIHNLPSLPRTLTSSLSIPSLSTPCPPSPMPGPTHTLPVRALPSLPHTPPHPHPPDPRPPYPRPAFPPNTRLTHTLPIHALPSFPHTSAYPHPDAPWGIMLTCATRLSMRFTTSS